MGRLTKRVKPDGDIDVGAFSDVAFLLLIFFILTTTFLQYSGKEVVIPATSKPENKKQQSDKMPSVNMFDGKITYSEDGDNLQDVSYEELQKKLMDLGMHAAEEDQEKMVVLEYDAKVKYSEVYPVITLIADAGGIIVYQEDAE